jgi:4-hydroxythreonine-4-phosphate dehydrogenase
MSPKPRLAITMGDPSGIGPEVVVKALTQSPKIYERATPFVVGALRGLEAIRPRIPSDLNVRAISSPDEATDDPETLDVLNSDGFEDVHFPIGELSEGAGRASHTWVETAANLCREGTASAMVTAPINKGAWKAAGIEDIGHLEVFRRLSGEEYVATMLVSGELRCMHLSTHKTLREACDYVTKENVLRAIRLTDFHFKRWGYEKARIAVAGLNPHASDGGLIGREDLDEIAPAVASAMALGIKATGPIPADSVFNQAIGGKYDVVIVMYHDQGHIPIKVYGFEESISVNLGIPWLRTSVDHGTAFDIAGQWVADEISMVEAIRVATNLSGGRALRA